MILWILGFKGLKLAAISLSFCLALGWIVSEVIAANGQPGYRSSSKVFFPNLNYFPQAFTVAYKGVKFLIHTIQSLSNLCRKKRPSSEKNFITTQHLIFNIIKMQRFILV